MGSTHETLHLLRAARETGLLEALLADADTAAEAAATTGVDERAAALVVDVLLAEGYLTRVEGTVEPTNRLLGFLAAADLRSVGTLPDRLDAVDALAALPGTMADGEPPDAGARRNRLGARAAADESTVRAVATAAVRAAPDADRVLVVDGAPGRLAGEFADRGLHAAVADTPEALDATGSLLEASPVDAEPVADGDPLPDGAHLVVATGGTTRRPPDEAERFVARLADAAGQDGTVVLVDRLWGRSGDAVPAAVEAYARDGGRVHDEHEVRGWFAAADLPDTAVEAVPGTELFAIVGRHG